MAVRANLESINVLFRYCFRGMIKFSSIRSYLQMVASILLFAFVPGVVTAQRIIGTIDFYGPVKVEREMVLKTIGIAEGDTMPINAERIKKDLLHATEAKAVEVEMVCCQEGKYSLFIGLDTIRPASKSGNEYVRAINLPDTIVRTYADFELALQAAVAAGESEDDLSRGYSLMKNESVRRVQEKFIPLANAYFNQLSEVLHYSSNVRHRAIAAVVAAYADDRPGVGRLYAAAISDPDPAVRNNVLRALTGLAVFAREHPSAGIVVRPTLFISFLHSVYWTDRDKALFCLVALTETGDEMLFDALRKEGLFPLLQMSQWRSSNHAFLAYIVLGRIFGFADEKIFATWQNKTQEVFDRARGNGSF